MARQMIVDVQNHVLPLELSMQAARAGIVDTGSVPAVVRWHGVTMSTPRDFIDVELHMQVCRDAGITHVMLHQGMLLTPAKEVLDMDTADAAKMHNDAMAGIAASYAGFAFPYGYLRPQDGKMAVREAERCLDELGFLGLGVDSSYGTASRDFLHTPESFEFWEFADDREVPVYIHPAMLAYGWEFMDRYKLDETVARPNETALCVSLMILSGLFDRFPRLRIILAHMGGSFTMCLPRLQFADRLGYEGFLEFQKARNLRRPMDYARENIWVDTMGFHAPGIRHAIEVYGIGHILLGSDYGPLPISPREHVDMIRNELGLSEEEQDMILGGNAKSLFGLADPA